MERDSKDVDRQQESFKEDQDDDYLGKRDISKIVPGGGGAIHGKETNLLESTLPDSDEENAWNDPDDESIEVSLANRARLRKLMRETGEDTINAKKFSKLSKKMIMKKYDGLNFLKWTGNEKREEADDPSDVLESSRLSKILKTDELATLAAGTLPSNILITKKLCESDYGDRLKSVVQTLDIHPENRDLVLAGGFDKTLKLYTIKKHQEYEDVYNLENTSKFFFENFPIKCAKFYTGRGQQIIISSIKKHIMFYDINKQKSDIMPNVFFHKKLSYKKNCIEKFELSGSQQFMAFYNQKNSGLIGLVSPRSKQLLFELKMNEECTDLSFLSETELLTSGERGNLYLWDLRMRRISNKLKDKGSVRISAIDYSNNKLAVGSSAGIVNVYDFDSTQKYSTSSEGEFSPSKTYDNLTTEITGLNFDGDSKRLVMASKWVKRGLRVANNIENCVYKNWPNFKTKMSLVNQSLLSEDGRRLIIGEDSGIVKVYQFD